MQLPKFYGYKKEQLLLMFSLNHRVRVTLKIAIYVEIHSVYAAYRTHWLFVNERILMEPMLLLKLSYIIWLLVGNFIKFGNIVNPKV